MTDSIGQSNQRLRAAKAVLAKHSITSAKMDLLRTAASRHTYPGYPPPDGRISDYGVRGTTFAALCLNDLISKQYEVFDDEQWSLILGSIDALAHLAMADFRHVSDWPKVLATLKRAEAIRLSLEAKVTRITPNGRAIVSEFLSALGVDE